LGKRYKLHQTIKLKISHQPDEAHRKKEEETLSRVRQLFTFSNVLYPDSHALDRRYFYTKWFHLWFDLFFFALELRPGLLIRSGLFLDQNPNLRSKFDPKIRCHITHMIRIVVALSRWQSAEADVHQNQH